MLPGGNPTQLRDPSRQLFGAEEQQGAGSQTFAFQQGQAGNGFYHIRSHIAPGGVISSRNIL